MAFQRALWHSGLTYKQTCNKCFTVNIYTDEKLDFRPWYADGFIYCATCRTPLRHSEAFAIDAEGNYVNNTPPANVAAAPVAPAAPVAAAPAPNGGAVAYCKNCGRQYVIGDANFCCGCGQKLD